MLSRAPLPVVSVGLLYLSGGLIGGLGGCASTNDPPVVAVVDPIDGSRVQSDETRLGSPREVKRNASASVGASTGFRLSHGYSDQPAPAFDGPCEGPHADKLCGTKGRISVEYSNHPLHADGLAVAVPCKLTSVTHVTEGSFSPESAAACTVGDELIASEECMMCRLPDAGWAVHARISEMTAEQAEETFKRLNLQGNVPTDAEGWQEAIARGQASPPAAPGF